MGRGNKEKGKNPIKLAKKKKKKNVEGNSKGEDNDMIHSETNDPGSDVIYDNNAPSEGEDPTRVLTTRSPSELRRGEEKTHKDREADQRNPLSDVLSEVENCNLLSANLMENEISEKREDNFKDESENYYAIGKDEMGTKVKFSKGTSQCDDATKKNENQGGEETQRKFFIQRTNGSAIQGGNDNPQKGYTELKGSLPEEGHKKNEEEPKTTEINADNGRSKKKKKYIQRYEPSVKINLGKGDNVGDHSLPGGEHPEEAKSCLEGRKNATASGDRITESCISGSDYVSGRCNNDNAEERQENRTTGKGCMNPSKEQTTNDYACNSAPVGEDGNIETSNEENIPLDELLYESTERAKKYNRTNYGLMGILKVIKMTDPQLNMLALGTDLTTLGLNLNSPDFLFSSFTSPITEDPTYNEGYFVKPSCYLNTRFQIRLSLLLKLQTETLFYIFYNLPRDILQAYAASELYLRKWTYHMNYKKWFFPRNIVNQGNLSSCRCWIYFDPLTWTKKIYNDFLTVKDIMHVQDITRCIEHIIQVQSNYSANLVHSPNGGNPNQGTSS
ncbi:CCR4-NOT transcription complex subunit 2, putative [Plasmodium knowlesi strain H]|uniref:CCR4-NOT transcription complex subunit 2, putative n=3 Tax=Plasmodium knowlesi TaxID=5850 RepID=A0A5K1UYD7_PLAKH|nr:CCR4-NOT transcription complex subunit 2, putative [Plasmodium knowlesi strain H]OTN65017.1 putative CCR4-NOT transcription complex subunit 2 [Plasmodium knowlesi]CAA9988314.1 CCR4-NOT transcription complex subunit 2, putative [Plasmodium knowlesi strain H]SBO20228.1 CCR4-NOT transcription complex subunit 2, putative [Plasmodium knowlesi strain H]SBO20261.1 CCR4-NOT transcription complex subunit 2, putative [Plasmodium knowlesi strain H]VVS77788.1 CCR4-NOT transcription complex subunit 2, p|eukprot:XP_002259293.1 NOT family protein, putative [Plasmodium knowlesi strain H]